MFGFALPFSDCLVFNANKVDLGPTSPSVTADLGLQWLKMSLLWATGHLVKQLTSQH